MRAQHQGSAHPGWGHWVLTTAATELGVATLYEVPMTFSSMWAGLQRLRQNEKHAALASLYALCCFCPGLCSGHCVSAYVRAHRRFWLPLHFIPPHCHQSWIRHVFPTGTAPHQSLSSWFLSNCVWRPHAASVIKRYKSWCWTRWPPCCLQPG